MSATGRRVELKAEHLLIGLLAADALVLAVVAVVTIRSGWLLVGDNAAIVLRGSDVLTRHPPQVGMPSGFAAWSNAANPSHPGPAGLWPMAPTAWFGRTEAVVLALTWMVAVGSAVLTARVAWRTAGTWVAIGATTITIAFQLSLVSLPMWQPLTPVMAAQPMLALCFVSWAITAGRYRYWPVWALLSGFIAQADLSYAPLLLLLGILLVAVTVRAVVRRRSNGGAPVLPRQTIFWTVGVVVVMWGMVGYEAISNGGGNVREMARAASADVPVAGLGRALGASLTALVGPAPELLPFALVAVAVIVVRAARTRCTGAAPPSGDELAPTTSWRKPGRRPAVAVAVVGVVAAAASQGLTPSAAGVQELYELPVKIAGAFAWFALGLLGWDALSDGSAVTAAHPPARRGRRLVLGSVASLLLVLLLLTGTSPPEGYLEHIVPAIGPVARQADAAVSPGTYRWRPLGGPDGTALAQGIALPLIDRGFELRANPSLAGYYGSQRIARGTEERALVLTVGDGGPPSADAELIASWAPSGNRRTRADQVQTVTDWVRAEQPGVDPRATSAFVGTIVTGLGARLDGEAGPPVALPDEEAVSRIGQQILDDPSRIGELPDGVITELALQRQVDLSSAPDEVDRAIEQLAESRPVRLWSARA